jgi:hypothetical protein
MTISNKFYSLLLKMHTKRVIKVKACKSSKNQVCFAAKKRVSKPRRSISKPRKSVSRKRSKPRKSVSSRGLVLSKSKDITSQIKNFFKIDQEIIYMIQHPTKAKRKNVLKLLGTIIIFLILLCLILKMLGSSFNCDQVITNLKDIASSVKNNGMNPREAISKVRSSLGNIWNNVKDLPPVRVILGNFARKEIDDLFTSPVEPAPAPAPTPESLKFQELMETGVPFEEALKQTRKKIPTAQLSNLLKGTYTVGELLKIFEGTVYAVVFRNMIAQKNWSNDYIPTPQELAFLANEIDIRKKYKEALQRLGVEINML